MPRPPHTLAASGPAAEGHGGGEAAAASQGFAAFRLLYEHRYLRYAEHRLGRGSACCGAVMAAFGALSAIWNEVLRSSCPAAVSWHVLGHAVSAARNTAAGSVEADALHDVLPARQADAVLLRHRLGMPPAEAADLMGVDESALTVLLREAERRLRGT